MRTIRIEKIKIADRQRQSVDESKVKELSDSIAEVGLLHPIVLRADGEGNLHLVAGYRRLQAVKRLHEAGTEVRYCDVPIPRGEIVYSFFEELSPIEAARVELEENIRRVDLTWQERALAVKRIHDLQRELDPNWTIENTSAIVSEASGRRDPIGSDIIRDRIVLAENLSNPLIASASSEREALKILYREALGDLASVLSARAQTEGSKHRIEQSDAVEFVKSLDQKSVTVVFTDPPYGIGADRINIYGFYKNTYKDDRHTYKDDWLEIREIIDNLFLALDVAAADSAFCIMFCSYLRFEELRQLIEKHRWETWHYPVIWYRKSGITPVPGVWPRHTYDCILLARRGSRGSSSEIHDVLMEDAPKQDALDHPAAKPIDIARKLAKAYIEPQDVVLDPFCGSGNLLLAASERGAKVLGCDIDSRFADIARAKVCK